VSVVDLGWRTQLILLFDTSHFCPSGAPTSSPVPSFISSSLISISSHQSAVAVCHIWITNSTPLTIATLGRSIEDNQLTIASGLLPLSPLSLSQCSLSSSQLLKRDFSLSYNHHHPATSTSTLSCHLPRPQHADRHSIVIEASASTSAAAATKRGRCWIVSSSSLQPPSSAHSDYRIISISSCSSQCSA